MANWGRIIIGDSRRMDEVPADSIHLVVTSPPYWSLKDYGIKHQIGYGQTLHEYLKDLYRVWKESYRVLEPGRRLVINIGDQFARSLVYGRYKIIPLHAEVIAQCEDIGFDYMGSIVWQKKTTMNTTGGANVMGSYPYPPNGMIEIDYEHILIFKKPGESRRVSPEIKKMSQLTREEWKEYFSGHWYFGGARQIDHQAMFPEELPRRLVKMFTFVGETVLDPFLGSGTTAKVALELGRNVVGYEINKEFLELIRRKVGISGARPSLEIVERQSLLIPEGIAYQPRIKDAMPVIDPGMLRFGENTSYKVTEVLDDGRLKLDSGVVVELRGIIITDREKALSYLHNYVLKKTISLRFDKRYVANETCVSAYVYLKNKICVNTSLMKQGLALVDKSLEYDLKEQFIQMENSLLGRMLTTHEK